MQKPITTAFYFTFLCLVVLSAESVMAQEFEGVGRIWNVEIEGNERYEDLVIERYIANQRPTFWRRIGGSEEAGMVIDDFEIRKDVIRIERFYQRRGYPNVEVTYELRDGSSIDRKVLVFLVTENDPIVINEVELTLNTDQVNRQYISNSREYSRLIQRLPFRTGRRYQAIEEAEVVGLLNRVLNNLGYIYATVSVEISVDSIRNVVDINIESVPGPRTRISSFEIEGAETLDERFIFRETGIEIGELYSEEKLREAQREVFKHHLFRLALINIPEQPQDSTLDLQIGRAHV